MGSEQQMPTMNLTANISAIAPMEFGGNESVMSYFDTGSPKAGTPSF